VFVNFLPEEADYFPPITEASSEGILAIGGNLKLETLLLAYQNGIFPWYNSDDPITWWAPDPRFVLYPERFKVSKSLKQVLKSEKFQFKVNENFETVISHCQNTKRKGQEGTWLTDEMKEAYIQLHNNGHAYSIETYENDELVGGFYGVEMDTVFSGESMFTLKSNASKAALAYFVENICPGKYQLIDCQYYSPHLESLGAEDICREAFMDLLYINS